ncbi:MAG: acyltransferase [Coriobacteriales bacterium]|nr:acyltransferase [Coriobacteriales bacterium]
MSDISLPAASAQTKTRIPWIDVARGAAMIAIVLGHTLLEGDIHTYLFSFHVPLFFVLSGLVFHVRSGETFLEFLARKAKALLIPYFFFGLTVWLIFIFLGNVAASRLGLQLASDSPLDYLIKGLLYGNGRDGFLKFNEPLWFLPALFVAECALYGLNKLLDLIPKRGRMVAFAGFTAISLIIFWLFNGIQEQGVMPLPFSAECAVSLLPFMICGWWFGSYFKTRMQKTALPAEDTNSHQPAQDAEDSQPRNPSFTFALALAAFALIAGGWTLSLTNRVVDYKTSLYGDIGIFFAAAVLSIVGWLLICYLIYENPLLEYIGKNTMSILCIHKLPILACQIAPTPLKELLAAQNLVAGLAVTAFAIAVSLGVGYILQKIYPPLVGKPAKSRRTF